MRFLRRESANLFPSLQRTVREDHLGKKRSFFIFAVCNSSESVRWSSGQPGEGLAQTIWGQTQT